MAFNPLVHLPQELIEAPQLPELIQYPFAGTLLLTNDQHLEALHAFLHHGPAEGSHIQPLNFTKYTFDELRLCFGTLDCDLCPFYFYLHWPSHPEKQNKDMSQKRLEPLVARSYWKRFGAEMTVDNNFDYYGSKIYTYRLFESFDEEKDVGAVEDYRFNYICLNPAYYYHDAIPTTEKVRVC
ncbi:hypothetical protein DCAR_0934516 [Daucus carota subsp. sativus]|uniref:Uncharacterized protein n=1 Tax=Daucus carota subsp. sativus TaxID=79200 RepID=A0A175YA55_DAUCS|nr:hypothetical protein DCAR_0934516 [Daucus carota subsp. sativus]